MPPANGRNMGKIADDQQRSVSETGCSVLHDVPPDSGSDEAPFAVFSASVWFCGWQPRLLDRNLPSKDVEPQL